MFSRLGNGDSTSQSTSGLFTCVVCQIDLAPSEGISVHAGSIFSTSSKPWQGPFLCADCRNKKDAKENVQVESEWHNSLLSHSLTHSFFLLIIIFFFGKRHLPRAGSCLNLSTVARQMYM